VALSLVERFFVWGKRLTCFPGQRTRFWVNLQCGRVVTRKPAKTRMGKGKGGRVGNCAHVYSGAWLLALSALRVGRLRRLQRQTQVRCAFPVIAQHAGVDCTGTVAGFAHRWLAAARLQTSWVRPTGLELTAYFRRIRRFKLMQFFRRILWRQARPARARLAPRWPRGLRVRRLLRRYISFLSVRQAPGLVRWVGRLGRARLLQWRQRQGRLLSAWLQLHRRRPV
jgi:hypothetical protein